MLCLTRKVGQRIRIGDQIVISINRFKDANKVEVGIEAPQDVRVLREEVAIKHDEQHPQLE